MSDAPAEVVALAQQRADARTAKDFAASDALRDEIAGLGWLVRDGADGFTLTPKPPYDVLASVGDLPDHSAEPDQRRATVSVLVEGWPDDLRTCLEALVAHLPDGVVVEALDLGNVDGAGDVLHEFASAHDAIHELHVERPAGWAAARTALLRHDVATVHVLLDPSTVLEGDALTPVLDAFDDPTVVGAGWRGVNADLADEWRSFADAGDGRGRRHPGLPVRRTALGCPRDRRAAPQGPVLPQRRHRAQPAAPRGRRPARRPRRRPAPYGRTGTADTTTPTRPIGTPSRSRRTTGCCSGSGGGKKSSPRGLKPLDRVVSDH